MHADQHRELTLRDYPPHSFNYISTANESNSLRAFTLIFIPFLFMSFPPLNHSSTHFCLIFRHASNFLPHTSFLLTISLNLIRNPLPLYFIPFSYFLSSFLIVSSSSPVFPPLYPFFLIILLFLSCLFFLTLPFPITLIPSSSYFLPSPFSHYLTFSLILYPFYLIPPSLLVSNSSPYLFPHTLSLFPHTTLPPCHYFHHLPFLPTLPPCTNLSKHNQPPTLAHSPTFHLSKHLSTNPQLHLAYLHIPSSPYGLAP